MARRSRNFRGLLLAGAAAAALAFSSCPSQAQTTQLGTWVQFVQVSCGASCADPIGFQSTASQNWAALTNMGTTAYIGSTYNGSPIDASALLNASQVVGATQLDQWLRTGDAPSQDVVSQITQALQYGAGYDVSSVTGVQTGQASQSSSNNNDVALSPLGGISAVSSPLSPAVANLANATSAVAAAQAIFNLATGVSSDGINLNTSAGAGTGYCNPSIAAAQNTTAQKFVGNMMQVITGSGTGYSQLGGLAVSSGQQSPAGVFGSSCLSTLMNASRDTLFAPPGLGSLLSQLGSMFTGGSGGGCGNAPSPLTQVAQSNPTGIYGAAGGFLPYLGFAAGEAVQALAPQITFPQSASAPSGALASLYTRPGQ